MMSNMTFQDYALVKQKMDEMRAIFDDYLKIVEHLNDDIEDNINNGTASALYSNVVGKKFKNQWSTLYSEFKILESFFSETYRKIGETTVSNAEYEETAVGLFGMTGDVNTTTTNQTEILDGYDKNPVSNYTGGGEARNPRLTSHTNNGVSYSTK